MRFDSIEALNIRYNKIRIRTPGAGVLRKISRQIRKMEKER